MFEIKKASTDKPILIAFAVMLAVLLLVGGALWRNVVQSAAAIELTDHKHAVISELDALQAAMLSARSGQSDYYLTLDKKFLVQRDAALARLKQGLQHLHALTLDHRHQHESMGQLQLAIEQRIAFLSDGQMRFEAQGFAAVRHSFDAGLDAAVAVGSIMQAVEREEQRLLEQGNDQVLSRTKVIAAYGVLLLAFIALLATLATLVRRRIGQRLAQELAKQDAPQRSLLKAGALQNAIFNSANFSSIATDAQGVIQIFNVGAERMLGYDATDVVDQITPAGISDAQEVVARAAALSLEFDTPITPGFEALVFKASRGIEDIYELTYIRKDGTRLPAIVSVTALRDAQGTVIGYLLIGTDNTVRKQVEAEQALLDQRLRDQQFYTRSLIESNIDAIMTTDPRGIISDVNHQMELLTGCTRDELIGAPFKDYFTEPARAEAAITRVLREGTVTNYELTAQARDGKQTEVSYNATTFHDRDRKLQGVFAAARDVTDRKQFEQTLRLNYVELEGAKAAAEKANLAKSEFLSSMSHELRTPLNAVLGFAQLMASDTPPPSPAQTQSIEQILKGGWYLLRLINEILDLAMIESGKVTMSQESMSLTDVLQDCQAMFEPQAMQRGIQMTFSQCDDLFYVHADRTRVKQVMINLLSNALKYNRVGGSVIVECVMQAKRQVRVSVKDTGTGLSGEQLAQLFQPFNRLGQEAGAEEGTGIGLVVTKQLVELMGGQIGVESNVGIGSTFWVELAASSAPELQFEHVGTDGMAQQDSLADPGSKAKRTLLYIEDNPANLSLVEQLIARRSDLALLSAVDGHLGIQMARTFRPDVILMDINLPGISGFGVLKILGDDPATAHIPVIALSANAVPRDVEKGIDAGFFRYLTKPIKVIEFMDALDVALQHAQDDDIATEPVQ
ncbi:MAG: PAS domain S-box-containing protein [Janthinobacterium sp.]|jgi:PAS domain S-box-containing protein